MRECGPSSDPKGHLLPDGEKGVGSGLRPQGFYRWPPYPARSAYFSRVGRRDSGAAKVLSAVEAFFARFSLVFVADFLAMLA